MVSGNDSIDRSPERSSATQIKWAVSRLCNFGEGVFRHVARFRGGYGFVCGVALTLASLMSFIWYGLLAYPLPWKVIDPSDPRFNPMTFRFSDYESGEMGYVLGCLFPVGTSKVRVDQILVGIGSARMEKYIYPYKPYAHPNEYKYSYFLLREALFRIFSPEGDAITGEIGITLRFDGNGNVEDSGSKMSCPSLEKNNVSN